MESGVEKLRKRYKGKERHLLEDEAGAEVSDHPSARPLWQDRKEKG